MSDFTQAIKWMSEGKNVTTESLKYMYYVRKDFNMFQTVDITEGTKKRGLFPNFLHFSALTTDNTWQIFEEDCVRDFVGVDFCDGVKAEAKIKQLKDGTFELISVNMENSIKETLSDKVTVNDVDGIGFYNDMEFISKNNVKEFIKEVKEEMYETPGTLICGSCEHEVNKIIDKRSGEKLI